MGMTREEFVRATALTGVAVAAFSGAAFRARKKTEYGDPTGPDTVRDIAVLQTVPPSESEDVLLTMQRDLAKAMRKPVEQRHWVMLIDQRKCVGCHACTIGCIAENKLPPGVVYRPVVTTERGEFPNVHVSFTPRPCMQCDNPSCTNVCPVNATWKRPDGVVVVDYDKCIGCRYCLTACPYGARTSDFGEYYTNRVAEGAPTGDGRPMQGAMMPYEQQPNHEYAKNWRREGHASPIGNARKCHFCLHRLERGMLPTCVTTCIGRATYFGDKNDPDSLVVKLITKNSYQTLLPHHGTMPQVFYVA